MFIIQSLNYGKKSMYKWRRKVKTSFQFLKKVFCDFGWLGKTSGPKNCSLESIFLPANSKFFFHLFCLLWSCWSYLDGFPGYGVVHDVEWTWTYSLVKLNLPYPQIKKSGHIVFWNMVKNNLVVSKIIKQIFIYLFI